MAVTSSDEDLIALVQAQLEGLRNTPDGLFLYRMIDRGLQNRGGDYTGDTGRDFIVFLNALLQKYASNKDGDTVTRIRVRLLQKRLTPYLENNSDQATATAPVAPEPVTSPPVAETQVNTIAPGEEAQLPESLIIDGLELDESTFEKELAERTEKEVAEEPQPLFSEDDGLSDKLTKSSNDAGSVGKEELAQELQASREENARAIRESMRPLVSPDEDARSPNAGISDGKSGKKRRPKKVITTKGSSVSDHISGDVREEFQRGRRKVSRTKLSKPLSIDPSFNPSSSSNLVEPDIVVGSERVPEKLPVSKQQVATNQPRQKSAAPKKVSSRDRVDGLHEKFAGKLAKSITRSRGYHKLLKSNLRTLKLADSPDDILDIKHLLVMGLEDLLRGNEVISKDLGATNHYLKISNLDRGLLKDELGRVRDLSLIDDLTGLQNKVAFGKQIEAEVGRSKRYGFSLALSVIVMDQFSGFAQRFGKDASNELIKTFANQVLAEFRGYDAVARLSGDKFGVLFPNTQKEGALSALEKAQKLAANTVIQLKGKSLRLPTFTSSLTLYSPGDKPGALMKRAYDALAVIDKNTRNEIIVALAQT